MYFEILSIYFSKFKWKDSIVVSNQSPRGTMSSEGTVVEAAPAAANNPAQANDQAQRRGWGATLRAMLFQMLIFYAITSFFRSSRPNNGGGVASPGKNMFPRGQDMVLVWLSW